MPEKPKRHRYSDPMAVECPQCHKPVSSPYGNGRSWHYECWLASPERSLQPARALTERLLTNARDAN